jgi:hypothetical protein
MEAEVTPVNVSSPGAGEEELVVGQERWEEMHRLKAAGMTVSGTAVSVSNAADPSRGFIRGSKTIKK